MSLPSTSKPPPAVANTESTLNSDTRIANTPIESSISDTPAVPKPQMIVKIPFKQWLKVKTSKYAKTLQAILELKEEVPQLDEHIERTEQTIEDDLKAIAYRKEKITRPIAVPIKDYQIRIERAEDLIKREKDTIRQAEDNIKQAQSSIRYDERCIKSAKWQESYRGGDRRVWEVEIREREDRLKVLKRKKSEYEEQKGTKRARARELSESLSKEELLQLLLASVGEERKIKNEEISET